MSKGSQRPKKVLSTGCNVTDGFQFPEIPEGYNPKGSSREITPDEEKNTFVEIDGFKITNEKEEDELCFQPVTNDLSKLYEYRKRNVYCDICKIVFMVIGDSVIHIHKTHECISSNEKNVNINGSVIKDKTVEEKEE